MRPYVGFDLFEQRMRAALAGLLAAVPKATKLAYFNTQSVCDEKPNPYPYPSPSPSPSPSP